MTGARAMLAALASGGPERSARAAARRRAAALLCVVGATAAVAAAAAASAGGDSAVLRNVRLPAGAHLVALSLDDGPDPVWTPAVLDLLARAGARATFFDVGQRALAHPALVRRELALGEIGDHTATHRLLTRLPHPAALGEALDGAADIARAGAPRPVLFRPPLGRLPGGFAIEVRRRGLRTVLWSVAVERYVDHESPALAAADVLRRVRPGSIVLAHDGGPPGRAGSVAALRLLLPGLRARGYRVVTVSELVAAGRAGRAAPGSGGAAPEAPVPR